VFVSKTIFSQLSVCAFE